MLPKNHHSLNFRERDWKGHFISTISTIFEGEVRKIFHTGSPVTPYTATELQTRTTFGNLRIRIDAYLPWKENRLFPQIQGKYTLLWLVAFANSALNENHNKPMSAWYRELIKVGANPAKVCIVNGRNELTAFFTEFVKRERNHTSNYFSKVRRLLRFEIKDCFVSETSCEKCCQSKNGTMKETPSSSDYVAYPSRWYILATYSSLSFVESLLWISFSPIYVSTKEYLNVSDATVNLYTVRGVIFLFVNLFRPGVV
jgi:hypothetical protein